MTRQMRRRFSPEYKEQAVARLLAPGATQASVAAELGVTPTQLKTWPLELEVAGLASAIERQQAEAGELARLRQANGITASMSRKGNCLDNAPMESFFGALKTELVHRTRFRTRREARAVLFEYIEVFYNRQRRHSSVGYRTPAQARVDMRMANAA